MPPGAGREMLDAGVRGLMTCDPSEVSLLHLLLLMRSAGGLNPLLSVEGGYQQDLVVGGAATMAERVADELGDRIRLLSPVREIAQSDRGVRVVADEIEVEADYAIVATPPGLADRISFTPVLPPDRAELLERMLTGSIIKFVVMYDEAFWRRDGFAGLSVGLGGPIEMTIDAGPPAGAPGVIAAFVFGPHALRMSELSAGAQRKIVLDGLAAAFGARAIDARRVHRPGLDHRTLDAWPARWPTFHPARSRNSAERCARLAAASTGQGPRLRRSRTAHSTARFAPASARAAEVFSRG